MARINSLIAKRVLVIPDSHVPYHDKLAWKVCLLAIKTLKPDIVVFIGDFADFYAVSFYSKNPLRKNLLKDEIELVNRELDKVSALGIKEVIFIAGNHEDRLERHLCEKTPELYGLIDLKELFKINDRKWKFVEYRDSIRIGKIVFTHDVERSGKNAISQSLNDLGHPIVFGHAHKLGVIYQGTVAGDRHVGMCVGWLGDFDQIDYKHKLRAKREWQHGFGLIEFTRDGVGFCQAIPILNGRCIVNGQVINANR